MSTTTNVPVVIDELVFELSSADLQKHLLFRFGYHRDKVELYKKKLEEHRAENLKDMEDQLFEESMVASKSMSNRVEARVSDSLQASLRSHASKAAYFKFTADHVVPNVLYRLNNSHLQSLEIGDGSFY